MFEKKSSYVKEIIRDFAHYKGYYVWLFTSLCICGVTRKRKGYFRSGLYFLMCFRLDILWVILFSLLVRKLFIIRANWYHVRKWMSCQAYIRYSAFGVHSAPKYLQPQSSKCCYVSSLLLLHEEKNSRQQLKVVGSIPEQGYYLNSNNKSVKYIRLQSRLQIKSRDYKS